MDFLKFSPLKTADKMGCYILSGSKLSRFQIIFVSKIKVLTNFYANLIVFLLAHFLSQ